MDQKIVDANIAVHTAMASTYASSEPHFRPENQRKVRGKLERLRSASGPRLLDVGCGTGFIIGLAKDLFAEIHGLDATQAMLDRVDRSSANVTLHLGLAEALPFSNGYFDAVSAYSFIHHLSDYSEVLGEMQRVLRPGGVAYIDLEPNKRFWQAIQALEPAPAAAGSLSDIVRRELDSVRHTNERVEREYGVPAQVFSLAEHYKDLRGGIEPDDFCRAAREAGFESCEVRYEWFLGQGVVLHGGSAQEAERVEAYLRRALPVSAPLFKYLEFMLRKPSA
ncbi:MAG TPA: methyltransferase domain-containing protein [Burkholderiales bacterium]|nr:methyltransferase domain-containing protein [Burkholderiales bacterium]